MVARDLSANRRAPNSPVVARRWRAIVRFPEFRKEEGWTTVSIHSGPIGTFTPVVAGKSAGK